MGHKWVKEEEGILWRRILGGENHVCIFAHYLHPREKGACGTMWKACSSLQLRVQTDVWVTAEKSNGKDCWPTLPEQGSCSYPMGVALYVWRPHCTNHSGPEWDMSWLAELLNSAQEDLSERQWDSETEGVGGVDPWNQGGAPNE